MHETSCEKVAVWSSWFLGPLNLQLSHLFHGCYRISRILSQLPNYHLRWKQLAMRHCCCSLCWFKHCVQILYSSCMTLTLYFCLLPWYNPFNEHMTQYEMLLQYVLFFGLISCESSTKQVSGSWIIEWIPLKHPWWDQRFKSRWAETHGIEYLQGGQQKPGIWSWLLGEIWSPKGSRLKLPIPRFNKNDLGDFSSIYEYISRFYVFLKKRFVSIFSFSFLHLVFC